MLKRKVYQELLHWRSHRKDECLLIKGARQIGKTYIVRLFGEQEYESYIEMNFLKNPNLREIFTGDLSSTEIWKRMTAYLPGIKLIEGKTLIFLDEIQKCAKARMAMKFLAEDRRFDVIASGSLLGLHYGQDADDEVEEVESIPVGYEHPLIMHSLDFEEFLWANGYGEDAVSYLRTFYDSRTKVPNGIHEKYAQLFREYAVVGGMPEVVQAFVEHQDFGEVQEIQEKILASYDDDISNHAKGAEKVKVRAVYASLPRQLAREYRKFKFSEVEKRANARKYGDSITWLVDANLVHLCRNVHEPYLPLTANAMDDEFKVYVHDTGLLLAQYGFQTKLAMLNGTLLGNAKGGIYENLIGDMLIKRGYKLHYYKTSDSTLELEFLIEKNGGIVPVEVKAGNTSTKSLNRFIETYHPAAAYKLIDGNVGEADGKITLPHYLAMFI